MFGRWAKAMIGVGWFLLQKKEELEPRKMLTLLGLWRKKQLRQYFQTKPMTEQLSETLAAEITAKHEDALFAAGFARDHIDKALNAAADCGQLIEKARELYHGGLHDWLREHVPTLPVRQAEIYHGIHKVRKKRQYVEADTRQLKLIGIIGDEELAEHGGTNKGKRSGPDRAIKWITHVTYHYKQLMEARPIETWPTFERNALVDALAPIVELYEKAKAGEAVSFVSKSLSDYYDKD